MAGLVIPDQHYKAFHDLANTDDDTLGRAKDALVAATHVCSRDAVARALRDSGFSRELVEPVTDALLSLGGLLNSQRGRADEVISDLGAAMGTPLSQSVVDVMTAPAVIKTAKVFDLSSAFDHKLHVARVLTDVRPVFGEQIGAQPEGAIVLHQLELSAAHDGQLTTLYVALDDMDLEALADQIHRAQQKSTVLRATFENAGLDDYTPEQA